MDDDTRLLCPAGFGHLVEDDADQRVIGAGNRHAEIIEHALPRHLAHRLRQVAVLEGACPFR